MAENEQDAAQTTLDEDQSEERPEQTVTVEDIGPARKSLTIEVPAERIAAKIEESYSQLQTDAQVPGFRRGRAPMRLLEKRFGSSVRDDVKGQLLSECYSQAIEEQDLKIIGEPDVKDIESIELPESGPLSFKVEVEVSPDVKLPKLEGVAVKKVVTEVTGGDVDHEIEHYRERFGEMIAAKGAKVQEDDYVQADVQILAGKDAGDDAEEIRAHLGVYIAVPGESREYKGHVSGIVVDDLGKLLKGKKANDVVSISMTGPSGHEDERIKDQPITIKINIKAVQRLEPAAVETVASQFGLETADELRAKVTESLEARHQREQQAHMQEQISDYLLEKVELALPQGLTERQAERLVHRRAMEQQYMGASPQQIEQQMAEMRAASQEQAAGELKRFFILAAAAEQLEIEVSEAEINGRIAMLAMQQQRRPEKLRQQMQRRGEIEHLYLQMREQKTLDKILESANIKEAKAEPKAEAKEAAATKKKSSKKKASKKKSSKNKATTSESKKST